MNRLIAIRKAVKAVRVGVERVHGFCGTGVQTWGGAEGWAREADIDLQVADHLSYIILGYISRKLKISVGM